MIRFLISSILVFASIVASHAQTAVGAINIQGNIQACSGEVGTGIVWDGTPINIFKARIMNQANWSSSSSPTGLWLIYLDPGSIYNNATGYVQSGGNAQLCPPSQPMCISQLKTLAKLDLHLGAPFIGPDYDWPVSVPVVSGDSIDFDTPCFGGQPAQPIFEIFYTYTVSVPKLVSAPGVVPEVYEISSANMSTALLPADWNPSHNQIIAYGASGATGKPNTGNLAPGAGAGAVAWVNNVGTAGQTIGFQVGAGGIPAGPPGTTATTTPPIGPMPGGDTFLCLTAPCAEPAAIVKAPGGGAGIPSASGVGTPGQGGQASSAIGTGAFSGGNGAAAISSVASGGGGGCAGPNGAGGNASGATGGAANGSAGPAGGIGSSPPGIGVAGNLYAAGIGPGSGAGAFTASAGPGQPGGSFCGAPSGGRQYGAAGIPGQNGSIIFLNWP